MQSLANVVLEVLASPLIDKDDAAFQPAKDTSTLVICTLSSKVKVILPASLLFPIFKTSSTVKAVALLPPLAPA